MPCDDHPTEARWQRLVTDRLAEVERLSPGRGSLDGTFWDRRAERYAASTKITDTEGEPFLRALRGVTDPGTTAIDVGAGTGRFALALAPGVRHITAVDPSAGMLAVLRRDAQHLHVTNLTTVQATWEQAAPQVADVVFSAFVLSLVADARRFVTKLNAAARQHVLLYLGAYCADAVLDPLWRHFHGAPRTPGPTYLDALAVLHELGLAPQVKVVEVVNRRRFATLEEAIEHYRDALLLPDTPEVSKELAALLATWLLGRRGALRSPLRSAPAAIVSWRPTEAVNARGGRRPWEPPPARAGRYLGLRSAAPTRRAGW